MKNEVSREFPVVLLPIHSCDGQTPLNGQYERYEILNPHSVMVELEKLLQETQPSLSGEALCQEGMRVYRQMEAHIPYSEYQRLYIQSPLTRSLTLHALRQAGIPLGVQSPFDKVLSGWLKYSQSLDTRPQTTGLRLHPRTWWRLLKNGVRHVSVLFQGIPNKLKGRVRLKRLKENNP